MTNPTQTAPAASIQPTVVDDKNKIHPEAAKTDAGTDDHAKPAVKADAAVNSEPAVAVKV